MDNSAYLERQVSYLLGNFTPKTSNYYLENWALGFPGTRIRKAHHTIFGPKMFSNFPSANEWLPAILEDLRKTA